MFKKLHSRFVFSLAIPLGLLSFSAWAGANSQDPTKPLVTATAVKPEATKAGNPYVLQSIFMTSSLKIVRINNRNVREGDHIQGAKVVKIEKNEVVLDVDGSSKTLRLGAAKPMIKKTVKR